MIFRTRNRQVHLNGKDIYMNFNEPNAFEKHELKLKLTRVHNDGDDENKVLTSTLSMLNVNYPNPYFY
jgi:hypothetical protein